MSTNNMDGPSRASYKKLQERFVSGHNGTSTWEIGLVASVAPVAVLLRNVTLGALIARHPHLSKRWRIVVDFSCLVLPVLTCCTILDDYVPLALLAMLATTIGIALLHYRFGKARPIVEAKQVFQYMLDLAVVGKRPFITNTRAYLYIATAVSILAVDFTVFPRRFCKAETYGTGLMDVGVGSFIISNAIVSPEARGKYSTQRTLKQMAVGIMRAVKSSLPLLLLGLCRLAAVKSVDYQVHVSEYGVHWNFFFTLAVVKVVSSTVLCVFPASQSWLVAVALASGYQYLLTGRHYSHYLLHGADGLGARSGLLDANREGLFSSLGYCSIYFFGVQMGMYLWQQRSKLRDWVSLLAWTMAADLLLWVVLPYSEAHVEPVSRRLVNIPFIIWSLAYYLHLMSFFLLVDIVCIVLRETGIVDAVSFGKGCGKGQRLDLCLLEATNRNGLFYFLLANLLTGAVNMSMNTILADRTTAMLILTTYMLTLSLIALFVHARNISLRIW